MDIKVGVYLINLIPLPLPRLKLKPMFWDSSNKKQCFKLLYRNWEIKMHGYSTRRDKLWHIALQLAEEETKCIEISQLEGNFMLLLI